MSRYLLSVLVPISLSGRDEIQQGTGNWNSLLRSLAFSALLLWGPSPASIFCSHWGECGSQISSVLKRVTTTPHPVGVGAPPQCCPLSSLKLPSPVSGCTSSRPRLPDLGSSLPSGKQPLPQQVMSPSLESKVFPALPFREEV